MANIIQQILQPSALVMVDEASGQRKFSSLKTVSVEVMVDSVVADVPFATANLSTQSQVDTSKAADLSSGKVVRPTHIRMKMMTDDISVAIGLINTFNDVTHQFSITSKEVMANHMSIVDLEIKQSPAKLNAVDISISWEQSGLDTTSEYSPLQPGDRSTYGVHVNGSPGLLSSASALYNKVLTFAGV